MPPLPGPDALRRPASASLYKPPLPTLPTRLSQQVKSVEIQLPSLIAGALVAAFAKAIADGLNNELLAHYYLAEQKVRINLDRVLDRLLSDFTKQLWDELFHFYHNSDSAPPRQVSLLFDGPIRQVVLVLNGPETSRCVLDKLGPGLSRRPVTWSANALGIDLQLALQLLCGFWHREFPAQSPGGSPDEIARSLHNCIITGSAARNLISGIRKILLSPHYVQMHYVESAVWDIVLKRPYPPPTDGFHVAQFNFECQLFGPNDAISDAQLVSIGSLPAVTGTASDCITTTVSDYVSRRWPKCGPLVLNCLSEALKFACEASRRGEPFAGMSVWDESDVFIPGLRLIHVEVESAAVRLSVSAWTHTLIDVLQQMAWTCAALSASPFPGALSECAVEVGDWVYVDGSAYVNCSLAHRPIPEGEGLLWLQELRGAAIATGFPLEDPSPQFS